MGSAGGDVLLATKRRCSFSPSFWTHPGFRTYKLQWELAYKDLPCVLHMPRYY
jgi:hypothetical protein